MDSSDDGPDGDATPLDRLLTVGELAQRTGLTSKAVRHYDRVDLLRPAHVDPTTGYRYYGREQLAAARVVQLLRAVDVPLEEVRACLASDGDPAVLTRTLARHRRRVEARAIRLRGDLHTIDHHLQELPVTDSPTTSTAAAPATDPVNARTEPPPPSEHRQLAVDLFNATWRLMETENRTPADDDRMLHTAHASRYHWELAGTAVHRARGEWLCSRVYAVLERGEPSRHHAQRVLDLCLEHGIGDWDLAFAHEALARAHAVSGDADLARSDTEQALACAEQIADPDDRELLLADLETIPGQPRFW